MITTVALGLLGALTLTVARLVRAGLLRLDPAAPRTPGRLVMDPHSIRWLLSILIVAILIGSLTTRYEVQQ